jgi:hypothetical protein
MKYIIIDINIQKYIKIIKIIILKLIVKNMGVLKKEYQIT